MRVSGGQRAVEGLPALPAGPGPSLPRAQESVTKAPGQFILPPGSSRVKQEHSPTTARARAQPAPNRAPGAGVDGQCIARKAGPPALGPRVTRACHWSSAMGRRLGPVQGCSPGHCRSFLVAGRPAHVGYYAAPTRCREQPPLWPPLVTPGAVLGQTHPAHTWHGWADVQRGVGTWEPGRGQARRGRGFCVEERPQ